MTSPSRIDATFSRLASQKRMAFMPFVTAGDPDLATTKRVIAELGGRGVDLIEVGFPYSDPIADGPVIQASYTRALAKKVHVAEIFAALRDLTQSEAKPLPPLVAMVAYAIIFRWGPERFVRDAREAGLAGLIVPDLPADEATELATLCRSAGLDLIELIAPTTTPERTKRILQTASGFIYCISVAGTTGVRDQLPVELKQQLTWLKTQTRLPLAVGFGISRPDQVESLRGLADGVIVGSAIVRHIGAISEQNAPTEAALRNVGQLADDMVAATHRAG
ncbi:MAG: tryptophan synthase subunit alpha [Planctomycetia bacterium]|nr:tryptophan synthase subunit alpha [Planctomycetia bacterium]